MRIAALDVGGTSIKAGIWDGQQIQETSEWETQASRGGAHLMERIKEILRSFSGFDAVGISTAGQVNTTDGSIHYANDNIPGYTGTPIREILEKEFQVPVAVENDVNAAALGEMFYGAAKGMKDFLCLTYGTGVGGAIVLGEQIYNGASYAGGSFGGIVTHPEALDTRVQYSGCYEKYASATALVNMAKKIDPALDSGRKIFEHFERPEVKAVIDQWIDEIVVGLLTLIHVFNPSDILLGGGVMSQPYILEEVKRKTLLRAIPNFREVKLHRTGLGNMAGMLGAVYLAKKLL